VQLQLNEKIKRAIRASLGSQDSYRAELFFSCFYLANYSSFKKPFDIFFYFAKGQWSNIKPVVEELIHRRADLRLGLASPGFKEEISNSLQVRNFPIIRFIPVSLLRSNVFRLFDTRILYTTIPSLSPYEIRETKTRRKPLVVNSLWSMNSLDGFFADDDFDAYDYILCAGSHHLDSFERLALRRPALSGKWLLPAGYPKLDILLNSRVTRRRSADPSVSSTVVYAPTHSYSVIERLVSLVHYGEAIVNALLTEGHRVIFRPHPVSFGSSERPVVDRICRLHAGNPNFSLDTSADYTESYSLADLMVTDISGTGFTFSFGFCRPCIFFAPNADAETGLNGIQFDGRHRIGAMVRDIDGLIGKTAELCHRDMADEIERFRDEIVFNVGKSAGYIVDCLEDILSGRERPEWVRL
jgi:hypothetical protein